MDPDIRCSKGLSLTIYAALFEFVVPNGNVHACFHSDIASKSSEMPTKQHELFWREALESIPIAQSMERSLLSVGYMNVIGAKRA